MIESFVLAVIVAFVVGWLLAIVVPYVLKLIPVPVTTGAAEIFAKWGWPLGVAAGIWFFFSGGHFRF